MEFFARLGKLITAAAAVIGIVFGLFNSILSDMVPPVEDRQTVLGVVSLLCLIVLLAISLVMPRAATRKLQIAVGLFALTAAVGVAVIFLVHRNNVATYIYTYPPSELPGVNQVRLIAGDLHEMGKKRAEGQLLAYAVQRNGGPDVVNDNQLLWTQQSRLAAERKLILGYEMLVGAITTLLFALGALALNRFRQKSAS